MTHTQTTTEKSTEASKQTTTTTTPADEVGDVHPTDCTQFQLDILAILAEEARYGLAIKRELEAYYDGRIHHGRLYPNLDDLVEKGLVEKSELDKRTNCYTITNHRLDTLFEGIRWRANRFRGLSLRLDIETASANGGSWGESRRGLLADHIEDVTGQPFDADGPLQQVGDESGRAE